MKSSQKRSKTNLPTVSVGIPAYNEEANIKHLLLSILQQKQKSFRLKEIIVVSDGSSDKTDSIVMSFKHKNVTLIRNRQRIGQALSQNKILKKFKGDLLLLLNADVYIYDKNFLNTLAERIPQNSNTGIISPKLIALPPKNLVERILYQSRKIKNKIYESINERDNLYLCHGGARVFTKNFVKKFRWPKVVAEDAYSYLKCRQLGMEFLYMPELMVFYKLPDNLTDHFSQSRRFFGTQSQLSNFFELSYVKELYKIPKFSLLKFTIISLFNNPIYTISYYLITFLSLIGLRNSTETSVLWKVSRSSKILH